MNKYPAIVLAALLGLQTGPASAVNVPSPQEGVFAPLAPCRIYKSVTANNNVPLPSGNYATVNVSGTGNFSSQGGPNGGCGVPASATAVAVSVTTSHATSTGTLSAFIPGSSSSTPGIAITFSPSLSQTTGLAIGLSSGAFQVEPVGGATNVTVDVTGYWAPQIEAYVNAPGTFYSATARILSISHTSGSGMYTLTTDRDVETCSETVLPYGVGTYAQGSTGPSSIYVTTWTLNSSAAAVPTDEAFNVTVTC